jgi:hypothetical protein
MAVQIFFVVFVGEKYRIPRCFIIQSSNSRQNGQRVSSNESALVLIFCL